MAGKVAEKSVPQPQLKKKEEVVHNSRKRYLEVQLNGAGVIVGMEMYQALKGQPNYTDSFKEIFPEMEMLTGSSNSSDKTKFDVTGVSALPTFEEGMTAVLFSNEALTALNTEDKFKNLADPNLVESIPIKSISAGEDPKQLVLERAPLDSNFKNVIILKNEGFIKVGQLTNFDVAESQDKIDADTQTSGGYKTSIGGLKSSAIENVTGLYDASIPSVAILNTAYDAEKTVRARHGAMRAKFAPYTEGVYKVTEFSTKGETSGNGKIEYSSSLELQAGQIEKKTYLK